MFNERAKVRGKFHSGIRVTAFLLFLKTTLAVLAVAQVQPPSEETVATTTIVRGRVLNSVTKEPIARALVTTAGDEHATMTNDRGQFELSYQAKLPKQFVTGFGVQQLLQARKPGFIEPGGFSRFKFTAGSREESAEVTIQLAPEALIVGHVEVPGSEGDVRIQCELLGHTYQGGHETWQSAGSFLSWANGEFRFSEVPAGTYKLVTHEQMDRDSLLPIPGAPLFGYPPVYYPNTTDFTLATPIAVKAGETMQVNLSVARRQYFPVHIPVTGEASGMNVQVHPMGHPGPGWSLGYNPGENAIEGMLPDGTYTLEAYTGGEGSSSGMLNFTVRGRPFFGSPLNLVPDPSLLITVREEFHASEGSAAGGFIGGGPNAPSGNRQRFPNAQIFLVSTDAMERFNSPPAEMVDSSDPTNLQIKSVRPGTYRINIIANRGYVASVTSGGRDLLQQPLVVALGGAMPAIEVTLRDDGAEVSGMIEGAGTSAGREDFWRVTLAPLANQARVAPVWFRSWDGKFDIPNVAPGDYLVLAYKEGGGEPDLALEDPESLKRLEGKGQPIHVEAGQKLSVSVKPTSSEEEQ